MLHLVTIGHQLILLLICMQRALALVRVVNILPPRLLITYSLC